MRKIWLIAHEQHQRIANRYLHRWRCRIGLRVAVAAAAVIIIAVLIRLTLHYRSMLLQATTIRKEISCSHLQQLRHCLLQGVSASTDEEIWKKLGYIWNSCMNRTLELRQLPIEAFPNLDEVKYMLMPFSRNRNDFACVMITLGVGNDVSAELKIKQRLPRCRFFGADPSWENNWRLYEQSTGGTFFDVAVGAKLTVAPAYVWHPAGPNITSVRFVAMTTFLSSYVDVDVVDMMTIDTEGAEFEVLPLLAAPGSLLNVTICQFNVEAHSGMALSALLRPQLVGLFERGHFVLLRYSRHDLGFFRLFFVNIGDKLCVERYIGSVCPN